MWARAATAARSVRGGGVAGGGARGGPRWPRPRGGAPAAGQPERGDHRPEPSTAHRTSESRLEPMSSSLGGSRYCMTTMQTLDTGEADIAYDVHGPLATAGGGPPLFMIGQPMTASGFSTLATHFPERTVVTYDPRGLGRSTRKDGREDHSPTVQAEDVHAVIE